MLCERHQKWILDLAQRVSESQGILLSDIAVLCADAHDEPAYWATIALFEACHNAKTTRPVYDGLAKALVVRKEDLARAVEQQLSVPVMLRYPSLIRDTVRFAWTRVQSAIESTAAVDLLVVFNSSLLGMQTTTLSIGGNIGIAN